MTVFVVSRAEIKDPEKMKAYAAAAKGTLDAAGAQLVARGAFAKSVGKEDAAHMTGVFEFPDLAAFDTWLESDAYTQIIPLREEACDMTFTVYQAA